MTHICTEITNFQISTGERTIESPFSERPISKLSNYWNPNSIQKEPAIRLHSPNSTNPTISSICENRHENQQKFQSKEFHSSYARCLNMPPMMMDQVSWLENELLETRQVSKNLF